MDKPRGLTSNEALQKVKLLFKARKAGHTGSLDPLATGLLPLCFGEATKFARFLLNSDKRYLVESKLGVATDTGDSDGTVIEEKDYDHVTKEKLEETLQNYKGTIQQVPSMFSAIKQNGKPLYSLARKGVEVPREPRTLTIHSNDLVEFEGDRFVLNISCSKGTYIRTVVSDIGADLDCGAHVTALRRTKVGPFEDRDAVTMELIKETAEAGTLDELLLPTSSTVDEWPSIFVAGATAYHIRHGQPVRVNQTPKQGWVKVCETVADARPRFLGVGEVLDDGRVAPRRLIA